MIAEAHAEQIENLTLVPVCPAPNGRYRIQFFVFSNPYGEAKVLVDFCPVQQIDNFEARFRGPPVYAGDPRKTFKILRVLQNFANGLNRIGRNLKNRTIHRDSCPDNRVW